MKLINAKDKIEKFLEEMIKFREFHNSKHDYKEKQPIRNELNQLCGELHNVIHSLGKNPRVIERQEYNQETEVNVYTEAFSRNDWPIRSINAVIDDLSYIKGRLASLTEKEFQLITNGDKNKTDWMLWFSPPWLLWKFFLLIRSSFNPSKIFETILKVLTGQIFKPL